MERKSSLTVSTHLQEEQLIDAYFHDFEVFDDTLKNILTKYTYQAIQKRKSVELRVEDYEKYREILPSVFERNLDIENLKDGHQCLMYSLTWPPFATFLEMFNDQQFFVSLNENCQKWIRKFIDVLKAVCDGICDGTVSVNDLRFILKNLENFRSVVRQLNEVTINMDNFESIIQTRRKEIEKYEEVADHVEKLNRVCERYLGAKMKEMEKRPQKCFLHVGEL
ncbi:Hypothetical predicted protein [Mytilus galloprovincialis]|uniref:Uncharacterized protein n=1 Tax=Mytilus galloprovincialis TaxID=29158 RepID=A0A8B6F9V5_MYTGA|nr:Hypothetical predicted protein [Mytilus galloprovincialis]